MSVHRWAKLARFIRAEPDNRRERADSRQRSRTRSLAVADLFPSRYRLAIVPQKCGVRGMGRAKGRTQAATNALILAWVDQMRTERLPQLATRDDNGEGKPSIALRIHKACHGVGIRSASAQAMNEKIKRLLRQRE